MSGTIDTYGVIEHYITEIGSVEDAGGGNVRVVRCVRRGGILVPVYCAITPITSLIVDSNMAREQAMEIFNKVQLMGGLGAARH